MLCVPVIYASTTPRLHQPYQCQSPCLESQDRRSRAPAAVTRPVKNDKRRLRTTTDNGVCDKNHSDTPYLGLGIKMRFVVAVFLVFDNLRYHQGRL